MLDSPRARTVLDTLYSACQLISRATGNVFARALGKYLRFTVTRGKKYNRANLLGRNCARCCIRAIPRCAALRRVAPRRDDPGQWLCILLSKLQISRAGKWSSGTRRRTRVLTSSWPPLNLLSATSCPPTRFFLAPFRSSASLPISFRPSSPSLLAARSRAPPGLLQALSSSSTSSRSPTPAERGERTERRTEDRAELERNRNGK